jgi:WD40 repeat protein
MPKATLLGHDGGITCVDFAPDGIALASGSQDTTIKLWDIVTGKARATVRGHEKEVSCVAFRPDGMTIISGSDDETIRIWDVGKAHHLDTASITSVRRRYWYQQQASQAELNRNWFAAAFYLDQLLKDMPNKTDLVRRRNDAHSKLGNAPVRENPLPPP